MAGRRCDALEWPYVWTAAFLAGRHAAWVFWLDFGTLGVRMTTQGYVLLSMALSVLVLYGLAALASGRRPGYWFALALGGTATCISVYDGVGVLACIRAIGCNPVLMPLNPLIPVATLVSASILTWRSIRMALTK
jgi:hypothetical protein